MRDIVQSTADFESWLRTQISLRDDHLQAKHADRFFSYAEHQGGPMAAEGKSVALSAAVWASGQTNGEIRGIPSSNFSENNGNHDRPHTN
jgi:hypothetical protein